jgi:NADH-quinone oxidoreductase subunit C
MAELDESSLAALAEALPGVPLTLTRQHGELNLRVPANAWLQAAQALRDHPELHFEQLIDLCGTDWSEYAGTGLDGPRYAVVSQLLSVRHNRRVRVKVFCPDDDYPMVDSVISVWPCANWYEREAFDLMGIVFSGHPDLRRLLTDYGFVGHPFRKDFPVSGHVEMRYDPEQQRVIYQPVSIEPRNNVPRVVREENYGDAES